MYPKVNLNKKFATERIPSQGTGKYTDPDPLLILRDKTGEK